MCLKSIELSLCTASLVQELSDNILEHLIEMFAEMNISKTTAQQMHYNQLHQSSVPWLQMQSNRTCLYCLRRKPENVLTCGHGVCETCIQAFGRVETAAEYRYRIDSCLLCRSGSLRVTLRPPTAGLRILSIDGGGVRGVVPLEHLYLLQNALGPTCKIQELFDLAFGTSSGTYHYA